MSKHYVRNAVIASGIAVAALLSGTANAQAATLTTGFSVARSLPAIEAPAVVPEIATYSTGAHIANYIQDHDMGKPYVYGATGPSAFDCSGLVMSAAHHIGDWAMPRIADDQYRHVTRVWTPRYGDLVFFHNGSGTYHVGVYIGTYWFQGRVQRMMVAAPYPGQVVRREGIYYPGAGYVTFGRP
jgi:cell wall-associated NlpC family hydrolase